jgi:glycosyltransferase involved in cell wall biosynthesis
MVIFAQTRLGRFEKWTQLPPPERRTAVFISIIIPAHNEEQFLPATLQALQQQSYPWFETIVVANGCSDQTGQAAQNLCDQCYELRERALGPARNLGARKARGELLLFLDADTLLQPDALEIIARQFTSRHAMGTLKGRPDSRKFSYKLIYFFKNLVHATHMHHGSSGAILCWKEDFHAVGGFNNELYLRENSDLMKRLRGFGHYKYIRRTVAITSMRRYEEVGTWEMLRLWLRVWFLSNFSDIRNQTYEVMTAQREPRLSRIVSGWKKRRTEIRPRDTTVNSWS